MRHAVWIGALTLLVTGGTAGAQNKKPNIVASLEGHRGGVSALAFNPKAPVLATGAGNGVVRLWDTKSGKWIAQFDPQKPTGAKINHIGFSADGALLSASSRNVLIVWDITPPKKDLKGPKGPKEPRDPKDPMDPGIDLPPRQIPVVFEDTSGNDPVKIGTVTGDGKRVFLSTAEGVRVAVNSRVFAPRLGTDTNDDLRGSFTPWALSAISDSESALVAIYGSARAADKTEQPAVAFVGLGDGKVIARGAVRAPIAGRPSSIGFAPDGKWLVACNGEELMYWRVPRSQVVDAEPKFLPNITAYAAAAGPNGKIAFASVPEAGKKVTVTITDVSGSQPKVLAVYNTDIERVSTLAFSTDGTQLAVGDDSEGIVQLWALEKK